MILGLVFRVMLVFALQGWAAEPVLDRLDPHGSVSKSLRDELASNTTACRVCHLSAQNAKQLKPGFENACYSCHGKRPHSGVEEHLSKTYQSHPMLCLDCHTPHRAGSKDLPADESPLLARVKKPNLPEGLIDRSNRRAMLKQDCTGCHRWK